MELSKFTLMKHIQSSVENGIFASPLDSLNDPYEWDGVRYPENYRVCCMSKAKFKMLLWSHYATHRGCRIDFELPDNAGISVRSVEYEDEFRQHADLSPEELVRSLYFKGSEWKYESEARAVWCKSDEAKSHTNAWAQVDDNIYLKAEVVRVTFGLLSERANEEYHKALSFLKQVNSTRPLDRQIEVCKCRLKNNQYQLVADKQFSYLMELERLERSF